MSYKVMYKLLCVDEQGIYYPLRFKEARAIIIKAQG